MKVLLEVVGEDWISKNLDRKGKKIYEIAKRGFDIVFSLIGLLITATIFPFIALIIKIDSPGSIFYSQKRIGKDGKIFTLYKFRTMKPDTEENNSHWLTLDNLRITNLGRILRLTHIDELPQFLNILKGDLSFVGPRPERVELTKVFEKEIPFYSWRYLIRPGFTGWAQINSPAAISIEGTKEKLRHDLYYIKNHSFLLDLAIILKTIKIIFKQ